MYVGHLYDNIYDNIITAKGRLLEYIGKHLWLKNKEAGFGCLCLRKRTNNLLPRGNESNLGMS